MMLWLLKVNSIIIITIIIMRIFILTIKIKDQLWQLVGFKEKQSSAFFPFSNDIEFKLQKLTSVREHKFVFGQAYQDFQRNIFSIYFKFLEMAVKSLVIDHNIAKSNVFYMH